MSDPGSVEPPRRYRFGAYEADPSTGELRRQGIRVKLHAQPFQVLCMLLDRPGELLTREAIAARLWPEGTFVDAEHGLNSAINRIREALGDTAASPRFVETLARRGYRFVAPVERIGLNRAPVPATPDANASAHAPTPEPPLPISPAAEPSPAPDPPRPGAELSPAASITILATADELPKVSYPIAQTLFILLQLMYLGFYVGALANLAEIQDLLAPLPTPTVVFTLLIVTAALLIPVRAFLLCAVLFHAPRIREKILRLWPFLLPFDILWALSPFLLLHHINVGLALACVPLLVYSPFAQRSLVLMGAGAPTPPASDPPWLTR